MSKSWGWCTRPFSEEDSAYYARQAVKAEPKYQHFYLCRRKGCGAVPDVWVRYSYITGRAGRVSYQERPYCRTHGEQAVEAHKQPEVANVSA